MAIPDDERLCSLEPAVGSVQACPGGACPFWEPGGAVLAGRCAVESLGVAPSPALASWLLEIRDQLATASSVDDERTLRGLFHHFLNESPE